MISIIVCDAPVINIEIRIWHGRQTEYDIIPSKPPMSRIMVLRKNIFTVISIVPSAPDKPTARNSPTIPKNSLGFFSTEKSK